MNDVSMRIYHVCMELGGSYSCITLFFFHVLVKDIAWQICMEQHAQSSRVSRDILPSRLINISTVITRDRTRTF